MFIYPAVSTVVCIRSAYWIGFHSVSHCLPNISDRAPACHLNTSFSYILRLTAPPTPHSLQHWPTSIVSSSQFPFNSSSRFEIQLKIFAIKISSDSTPPPPVKIQQKCYQWQLLSCGERHNCCWRARAGGRLTQLFTSFTTEFKLSLRSETSICLSIHAVCDAFDASSSEISGSLQIPILVN